jgi:uncharacterized repeat protein (TIGR01451 family)
VAKNNEFLTYTVSVRAVVGTVHNVTVRDVLPAHLDFVSFGDLPEGVTADWDLGTRTMTWTLPDMTAGESYQLTYQVQVDSYMQEGAVLRNNAELSYTELTGTKQAVEEVKMATLYTVRVGVYNAAGELVKVVWEQELSEPIGEFSLVDAPSITSVHGAVYVEYEGNRIATWDGTNGEEEPVSNGAYYVKIDNVDPYGVVSTVEKVVTVSRSIAKVEVNIFNEAGEIVRHLYGYMDDPENLSTMDVSFSTNLLQPTEGTPVPGGTNVVHITSSAGMDLQWDGKSDSGAIVANGHYEIEVHYVDGKGGESAVTRGIVVQSTNEHGEEVYAKPNVLADGQTTTTVVIDSARAYTLNVQLYDVAGELIKAFPGVMGANEVLLDVKGLASGLYIVVVELKDADGKFAGRKITKIVIKR